jgi:4'-phosphopantetheinyl transferase
MSALPWKPVPSVPALAVGDVHVWLAALDSLRAWKLHGHLSPDEVARADRFRFPRDRQRFVAARGLLRELLGRYLEADPAGLRFAYGPRGKPALADGAGSDRLHFNVSHSGGLALLAFARGRDLGIDLELERPVPEAESIAERYFSPREGAELRRLSPAERPRAFFRCWTRKEAFIKATGDGLSRPLDAFDVTLAPREPARLLRVEGEPEETARWWMEGLEPAEGFAGALAVEGRPARLACWKWDDSLERSYGPRREGRQDDLQGGREPRGAVLDLAR